MHVFLSPLVVWAIFWVGTGAHDDFGPCYRDCERDPEPRTCYYKFRQELYATLTGACGNCSAGVESDCYHPQCVTADGYERSVITINRQIPGTPIHVCQGDEVVVDFELLAPGHGDTIHWHGILQKGTNWMDGVAMITQCPVMQGQIFRYRYQVPDCGTYFYHPHYGISKPNGPTGVLIVRCGRDPQRGHYDLDCPKHTVILNDWTHEYSDAIFPGLASRIIGQPSVSCLINGRGIYTDPTTNVTTKTPMAKFALKSNHKHRFRLINAGSQSCPISFQIQGHRLTIIAADGENVVPKTVDIVTSFSGERYDFVVEGNQSPQAYWIHVFTSGFCANNPVEQWAVLYYEGQNSRTPSTPRPLAASSPLPTGVILGSPSRPCGSANTVCPTDLRALQSSPGAVCWRTNPDPENTKVLPFKFYAFTDNELFNSSEFYHFTAFGSTEVSAIVDTISFKTPSSALLIQPRETRVCDRHRKPRSCRGGKYCQCTHVIKLPAYECVTIVMVDTTDVNGPTLSHPFHIHGFTFWVRGWGTLQNITNGEARLQHVHDRLRLGSASGLEAKFGSSMPAKKDVLVVPGYGYTIVTLYTNNPGIWFYHCHFQYHMAIGMELVFQVGKFSQFPRIPEDFPRCGNYIPR